ncbi:aldo/keto reductase [Jatrophihabitans telluris]|uniref:Aldo/keto reductase n=1 Tax=Jatrophihabitans telluris TaxID=2038343 RepID=A0ABY4R2J7_9ACTN|nr:aldo/keto reductase [Jatrophihabitans telluris]UQX89762.1 aldo/keto reductase [Jatrophihabitans telluris]
MITRRLGRTALTVSALGFGAASLGNLYRPVDEDTAFEAVQTAWAAGIRYFDTAPHYGLGLSERRLGDALAGRPRGEFVLSTKVGRLLEPNPSPSGSDLAGNGFDVPDDLLRRFDFSGDGVRRSLDESLGRLGLDRIDVVYVHDPDEYVDQAIMQAIPALIDLRDQGVIGAVGVGMNQWRAPLRMVSETDLDVVMLAGRWTLLDRSGRPLLDACAERGISVVAAAPYNSGLLSTARPPADAMYDYQPVPAAVLARANRLADICQRHAVALPEAAIQFGLRHPAVASVVVGCRTPEQVHSTAERYRREIDEQTWSELEA